MELLTATEAWKVSHKVNSRPEKQLELILTWIRAGAENGKTDMFIHEMNVCNHLEKMLKELGYDVNILNPKDDINKGLAMKVSWFRGIM